MSVNRDYLPFKSARQYQDRKMAKWMGFFLSEHTTALNQLDDGIDFDSATPFNEKVALLSQLFAHQLEANFSVRQGKKSQLIKGVITQVVASKIGIHSDNSYQFIEIKDLLSIQLVQEEELHDES